MHKILMVLAAVLTFSAPFAAGQIITKISSLGSLDFSVDSSSTTASYGQSISELTFSGSQSLGATLGGVWNPPAPKDWSAYSLADFGILGTVTGTNPNMPFTLEFYDSNLLVANTFSGSTISAGSSTSFMSLTLSTPGNGNMNDIFGLQFTWNSNDAINFGWEGVAVVPEPSTYMLIVLAGIVLLALHFRKEKS